MRDRGRLSRGVVLLCLGLTMVVGCNAEGGERSVDEARTEEAIEIVEAEPSDIGPTRPELLGRLQGDAEAEGDRLDAARVAEAGVLAASLDPTDERELLTLLGTYTDSDEYARADLSSLDGHLLALGLLVADDPGSGAVLAAQLDGQAGYEALLNLLIAENDASAELRALARTIEVEAARSA